MLKGKDIQVITYKPDPSNPMDRFLAAVRRLEAMEKSLEVADKLANLYYLECVENNTPTPELLAEYFQLRGEK